MTVGPSDDEPTPAAPSAEAADLPEEATVLSRRRQQVDDVGDATVLATRRRPHGVPDAAADDLDEQTVRSARRGGEPDEATVLSARRAPAPEPEELDDRTVLSARRAPAPAPEPEELDDLTVIAAPRRTQPAEPDDLDATSIAAYRRATPEPFSGTSAPSDSRMTGGTTIEDRTDETVLRSVRRATPSTPPAGPEASSPGIRRTAYVPGEDVSDRRAPRSSGPVMASRAPVAPPASATPPPAPDGAASRRRRARRRLLIAAAVAVVVIVGAVVALVLLLT